MIAADLAVSIGADCLVYAGREPGVVGPDGRVVERVRVNGGLPPWLGGAGGFDQTGGMAFKVLQAARAAAAGVRTLIVGGDSVLDALLGGRVGSAVEV